MKTTKALLASVGTSMLLVACSITMLAVVSALLAFDGFPGPSLDAATRTLVIGARDGGAAPVVLSEDELDEATGAGGAPDEISPTESEPQPAPLRRAASSFERAPARRARAFELPREERPRGRPGDPDGPAPPPPSPPSGLDLGRTGRDATALVADGVVRKVSPGLADVAKDAAEPLWATVDRDPRGGILSRR